MKPIHVPISMLVLLSAAGALAQDKPAPGESAAGPTQKGQFVIKPADAEGRKNGIAPGLALGANFNLTDNRNVVGQPDGTSLILGATIDGSLEYNFDKHEWRNAALIGAGVTRTPAVNEFLKTRDNLTAESIYLHHVIPIFGPFARAGMNTQMFGGYDIRPAATTYSIAHVDGTTETLVGRRLRLTDPFEPLTLKESLGVFVQPVTTDRVRAELRGGLGAQEVFADKGLAVADDVTTPDVTAVKELASFNQIGAELVGNVWGAIDPAKRILYTAGVGVLVPFVHTDLAASDDRSAFQLANIEVTAGLSVKLVEWAALDYKLAVLRQPQLIDTTQVTNNILLTIGIGLGTKAPVPPTPPACVEAAP